MAIYLGLLGALGLIFAMDRLSRRFAHRPSAQAAGPDSALPVMILDYDATREQFALHYDPSQTDQRQISINPLPGQAGMAELRLNRQVIAYVTNGAGLRQQDIMMIPAPYRAAL